MEKLKKCAHCNARPCWGMLKHNVFHIKCTKCGIGIEGEWETIRAAWNNRFFQSK